MFTTDLFEQTSRPVTVCFGRMNPPTLGHGQLLKTVQENSNGDYYIFATKTHKLPDNPLPYDVKFKFLQAMFPQYAEHMVYNPDIKTIIQVAQWLYDQGYTELNFVAGSDRIPEFQKLLTTYNGKGQKGDKGYYIFSKINMISAGERDPDAEGLAGISASKARAAAVAGDFDEFRAKTGAGELAKPLYDAVREAMGVSEDIAPDGQVSTSPIHGSNIEEEAAGVGVVASNKKMAKDPRYSMSITKDVKPTTPKNILRALRLAEGPVSDIAKVIAGMAGVGTALGIKQTQQRQQDKKEQEQRRQEREKKLNDPQAQQDFENWFKQHEQQRLEKLQAEPVNEKWSQKQRKSVNCNNPKGFSQKAHCAGRKARQAGRKTKSGPISESKQLELATIPMIKKFLPIVKKELEIDRLPKIKIQRHVEVHDGQATFGRFVNGEQTIYVGIADRHPVDVLRTLAHELVHWKQFLEGRIEPGSGETGSRIENEAHAVAGILMRHFNKKYPNAVKMDNIEIMEDYTSVYDNMWNATRGLGPKDKIVLTVAGKYARVKKTDPRPEIVINNDYYDKHKVINKQILELRKQLDSIPRDYFLRTDDQKNAYRQIKELINHNITQLETLKKTTKPFLFKDSITESKDYVTGQISYSQTLNPVAWEGDKLKPEVRDRLLKISGEFVKYLEVPGFEVLDVVLTGSMANYNWTKYSDFDLHVVTNYSDLECDNLAEVFYRAKKELWNSFHDITIGGHEVEMYVEDSAKPPVSAGIFSILENQWVKKPTYDKPEIDKSAINAKARDLIQQIKTAIQSSDSPDDIQRIKDKLRKMRRAGLDTAGEFSVENLTYKILRNMGILNKMSDIQTREQDRKLSIPESKKKIKFLRPGELQGSYTDSQLRSLGFRQSENGSWFITQDQWEKLVASKKIVEGDLIPWPKGTVKVDVSDVYDWYKLGQHISNLKGLGKHDFGKGPPQTVMAFGSEPLEHEYIKDLNKIGLKTYDIDENAEQKPKYVYRIDSEHIKDFEKSLKTYYHNKDFTISGRKDFEDSVDEIKGVYAADLLFTALYSTGSSEGDHKTRYVAIYGPGQPVVYFSNKDRDRIKNNISWLTVFDADNFFKLPSGEYFSEKPGAPVKQFKITDPFAYIKKRGWRIKFVEDLKQILKLVVKKSKTNRDLKFGAEGMGYMPMSESLSIIEGKMAELDMDLEDPDISDRQFEKIYGMTRREARELFSKTNIWDFPQVKDPDRPLHEQDVTEGADISNQISILFQVNQDSTIDVTAMLDGEEVGHVNFDESEGELIPQDLYVKPKYRGQGIAAAMYNYTKSKGYTILRGEEQTDDAIGLWNKHRPGKDIWEQGVVEGKLHASAIFLNPNTVIVGQVHGKPLELSPEISQRVQTIAKKHGAWYEGNGMDRKFTKGIIDDYQGSWDDDLLSPSIKGYPYPFLYVLFSNIKANDTVKGKIGSDPKVTIFDRILNTQPSTNYFPDRTFSSEDLTKFLKSVSQGPYDFLKMSQAPATEKNVQKFFKIGEKLMWPENWEEYPNKAGQLAKRVNDLRDKFLASRKSGVYVVGSSHLMAVRDLVNKQGVAESLDESLDSPYSYHWEEGDFGDLNAYAKLSDNTVLDIEFEQTNVDKSQWNIGFQRDGQIHKTGKGDEQRVFATVLSAIKEFIENKQPKEVFFSAEKSKVNPESRKRLYDRLVQKYATALGYQASQSDTSEKTIYKLLRISKQGVAEGFPQPGESSGKAKQFNPNAKVQTREMTLDQILNSVKGIPYVNNVVDDWDAKDYSWGVTKKVIEYAQYLQKNPQSVANLPPLVVIDGQLNDGAHRLSAINLLQKRMDPKNPLWKQVKLKVNFGTSADVASEQGVAENNLTEFAPGPDFRDDDDRQAMSLLKFAEIIKLFLGSEYTMIDRKTPEQVSVKFDPKDRTNGHNGAVLYSIIGKKQNEYPTVNFQLIDYEQGPQVGRGRRAGTAILKTRANALKIADIIYNTMGLPEQDRQVKENFSSKKIPNPNYRLKETGPLKIAGQVAGAHSSANDVVSRFQRGDYAGAGIGALSTIANLKPGLGTAVSLGLDYLNAQRDKQNSAANVNSPEVQSGTANDEIKPINPDEPMQENFADGKKPGRKGLAKRMGVPTKASVSRLRQIAKSSSGEKQRMAHWMANMKAGKRK